MVVDVLEDDPTYAARRRERGEVEIVMQSVSHLLKERGGLPDAVPIAPKGLTSPAALDLSK